jgi:septal ring factor EnvC (AmiA/AmiB activator)
MERTKRTRASLAMALLVSSSLLFFGCPSKPSAEELKQLNDLKEEYAALQKELSAKEKQVADLEKEVADKNAKLKKCNDDHQVVKQRLGQ